MTFARYCVAIACWAATLTAPVLAQTVAGGLFGATKADSADRDKLDVLVEVAEAFDSEVPMEFSSLAPQNNVQSGGRSTMFAASANYAQSPKRVQLFGSASTYFRHVRGLDRLAAGSQTAQLGASVQLPNRGRLEIAQAAAYSPSYLYQLLPTAAPLAPGEAMPVNPEFQIDQTESYSYNTRMTLAFGSVRGTRLTTTARYGRTDVKNGFAARRDLMTYAAGARVSRAISRNAAFSVGYEYSAGQFGLFGLSRAHRGMMGVEYSPALSVTRRAMFRLDVASSMFQMPESALSGVVNSSTAIAERVLGAVDQRLYPLQGEASVDYPFRLKWRAVAGYRRSVEYLPGMTEPMFTSGARIRLVGVIGRRVDVSALAGSATAASVISAAISRNVLTHTGEARFRYALTRTFALYSAYTYYYYDLRGRAQIQTGLPDIYKQHGIRAGIMLFTQPLGR